MTATDELRRLLDGRGVVHVDYCGETAVRPDGGYEIRYYRRPEPNLVDAAIIAATPAQAVEATLGRGTCKLVPTRDKPRSKAPTLTCSECGWWTDEIGKAWNYCPSCGRRVIG